MEAISQAKETVDQETLRHLAIFRYRLRKFLRFSEQAARKCGVTPQQHQLLLGIAGYTSERRGTISELAEFMQERHNSIVELVARAVKSGLVRKAHDKNDRRFVFVVMTRKGESALAKLSALHKQEVARLQAGLLKPTGRSAGADDERSNTNRSSKSRLVKQRTPKIKTRESHKIKCRGK